MAHSGFITDTHAETVQISNEPITFGYWFWHGGFLVAVSYLIIVLGTAVFIKHRFSPEKELGIFKNNFNAASDRINSCKILKKSWKRE